MLLKLRACTGTINTGLQYKDDATFQQNTHKYINKTIFTDINIFIGIKYEVSFYANNEIAGSILIP
jgi:hypothetical protein